MYVCVYYMFKCSTSTFILCIIISKLLEEKLLVSTMIFIFLWLVIITGGTSSFRNDAIKLTVIQLLFVWFHSLTPQLIPLIASNDSNFSIFFPLNCLASAVWLQYILIYCFLIVTCFLNITCLVKQISYRDYVFIFSASVT